MKVLEPFRALSLPLSASLSAIPLFSAEVEDFAAASPLLSCASVELIFAVLTEEGLEDEKEMAAT